MKDIKKTRIKKRLKSIDWDEFYNVFSSIIDDKKILKDSIRPLYKQTTKENIKFKDSNYSIIKNKILSEIPVGLWKITFSPLVKYLNNIKYNAHSLEKVPNYEYIFLISCSKSNVFNLLFPILKKIDEKGISSLVLTRKSVLKKRRNELRSLENTYFILEYEQFKSLSFYVYKNAKKEANEIFLKILKYLDDDSLIELLKTKKNLFKYHYKGEYIRKSFYKKLLSNSKAKTIIGHYIPESCIEASKENSTKTIMLQHGIQWGEETGKPFNVDEVIVWGEYWENNFISNSSKKTKVLPLGNPRFDEIIDFKKNSLKKGFHQEYNLELNVPTIVFLSQPYGEFPDGTYKKTIKDLESVIKKMGKKVNFLIKLHPREDKEFYYETFDESTTNSIKIIEKEDLFTIFKNSEIAISIDSTALIEATVFEIPIIKFLSDEMIRRRNIPPIYLENNWGRLVKNSEELLEVIEDILKNEDHMGRIVNEQNEFKSKLLTNLGFANKKIVKHLLEIT
ncbi:MAG: CDP-glycerol glycerophosphotransferase family protein [archaeon]